MSEAEKELLSDAIKTAIEYKKETIWLKRQVILLTGLSAILACTCFYLVYR